MILNHEKRNLRDRFSTAACQSTWRTADRPIHFDNATDWSNYFFVSIETKIGEVNFFEPLLTTLLPLNEWTAKKNWVKWMRKRKSSLGKKTTKTIDRLTKTEDFLPFLRKKKQEAIWGKVGHQNCFFCSNPFRFGAFSICLISCWNISSHKRMSVLFKKVAVIFSSLFVLFCLSIFLYFSCQIGFSKKVSLPCGRAKNVSFLSRTIQAYVSIKCFLR